MQEESRATGLRETKKRATRRELTAAARRLALDHGLDGVTVEAICSSVGVSVRTFFNYFGSKEDSILGESAPVGDETMRQAFRDGGPSGDLLDDLMLLLDPTPRIDARGRDDLTLAMTVFAREPRLLALQFARGLQDEQELALLVAERRGLTSADSTSVAIAALARTVLIRGLIDWATASDERPLTDHVQLVALAVRALGQPANGA